MPTYGKNNFKESNVNYLNKDFAGFRADLINYAQTYFPSTYTDFSDTSPGVMFMEMASYVGDVLSFYLEIIPISCINFQHNKHFFYIENFDCF